MNGERAIIIFFYFETLRESIGVKRDRASHGQAYCDY